MKPSVTEGSLALFAAQKIVLDKTILSAIKNAGILHTGTSVLILPCVTNMHAKILNCSKKSTRMGLQLALMDHIFKLQRC